VEEERSEKMGVILNILINVCIVTTAALVIGHFSYHWFIIEGKQKSILFIGNEEKGAVLEAIMQTNAEENASEPINYKECFNAGPIKNAQDEKTKTICSYTNTLAGKDVKVWDTPAFVDYYSGTKTADTLNMRDIFSHEDDDHNQTIIAVIVPDQADNSYNNNNPFYWLTRLGKIVGQLFWTRVILVRSRGINNYQTFEEEQKLWEMKVKYRLLQAVDLLNSNVDVYNIPVVYLDPHFLNKTSEHRQIFLSQVDKMKNFLNTFHYNIILNRQKQNQFLMDKYYERQELLKYYSIALGTCAFLILIMINCECYSKLKIKKRDENKEEKPQVGKSMKWNYKGKRGNITRDIADFEQSKHPKVMRETKF
jgi:hypothetical protein